MIEEGRMSGEIDQVDEIIRFDQLTPEQIWNNQIKYTCDQINATGGLIFFLSEATILVLYRENVDKALKSVHMI